MAEKCSDNSKTPEENIPGPLGVKYDDCEESIDVILVIPGVKKPSFVAFGKNTVVDLTVKEQSVEVFVELKKRKNQSEKCKYSVKKLPGAVVPSCCSYKLKDNQVVITLKKATSESWQRYLDTAGLETSED